MDLCKVADGTYDAYFEPHLHKWMFRRLGRRRRGMGGAGASRQWNGELIHWRRENDVVVPNGLIDDELRSRICSDRAHTYLYAGACRR